MSARLYVIVTICILFLVTGCTPAKNISTPEIKALSKELKQEYEQLKRVEIQTFPTRVEWVLTWKETPDENDSMGAFELIRDYVAIEEFEQNVVEELYMKEYPSEEQYPSVHVIYDMNNDKTFDRAFHASYDETNGYAEWYYSSDYLSEAELLR